MESFEDEVMFVAQNCLAKRIRKSSRTITKIFNDALAPLDLTSSQCNLLIPLAVKKDSGMSPAKACELLGMEKSTLSRNMKILIKRGLAEVQAGSGASQIMYRITEQGCQILSKAFPLWRKANLRASSCLAEENLAEVDNPRSLIKRQ